MILLFDLDDTLCPEKIHIYQGFRAVAKYVEASFGIDEPEGFSEIRDLFRTDGTAVFDTFIDDRDLPVDPMELVRVYRSAERALYPYPEAVFALETLRKDYPMVLLTNGDSETQWNKLNELPLQPFFHSIFVLDDFGKEYWKPEKTVWKQITDIFGENQKYVMIGNSDADLDFAGNIGIDFILVKRPGQIRTVDEYDGPTVRKLTELPVILKQLDMQ